MSFRAPKMPPPPPPPPTVKMPVPPTDREMQRAAELEPMQKRKRGFASTFMSQALGDGSTKLG